MASKKAKKKKGPVEDPNSRTVCRNRRARHDYEIVDEIECGIVLMGSEVKSIRNNKMTIDEAYARIQNDEFWLLNCDIAEYPQATCIATANIGCQLHLESKATIPVKHWIELLDEI